jgi:RNA polymerase sigma-70 factor (ECF subfamily)
MHDISRETIIQASRGDIAAFEAIYKYACGFVYNVAFRLLSNKQDAEEATQDVFITLHRKLDTYRFESSLKTWTYRITFNLCMNRLQKRKREEGPLIPYEEALKNPQTEEHFKRSEEASIVAADQEKQVQNMLEALPADQKTCIILRSIEGLSYEEIAASMNTNINTVRSRLKRAREKMIAMRNAEMKNEL